MYRLNQIEEHEAVRAYMLRRAERRRFVREALGQRQGRVTFYAPLLLSLGRRLMLWGRALESRYAPLPDVKLSVQNRLT